MNFSKKIISRYQERQVQVQLHQERRLQGQICWTTSEWENFGDTFDYLFPIFERKAIDQVQMAFWPF